MKEVQFTKDKNGANIAVIAKDRQGVQLRVYTDDGDYVMQLYVPDGAYPYIFLSADEFEALGSIAVRMRAEAAAKAEVAS